MQINQLKQDSKVKCVFKISPLSDSNEGYIFPSASTAFKMQKFAELERS